MKSPETKLKVMENYDLNNREFKAAVMKKFNDVQENSGIKKLMNKRSTLPKKLKL